METKKSYNKGSENHFWKGGVCLSEKVCESCGKEFMAISSMVNSNTYRHKGKYCSVKCFSENQRKEKISLVCQQCGNGFKVSHLRHVVSFVLVCVSISLSRNLMNTKNKQQQFKNKDEESGNTMRRESLQQKNGICLKGSIITDVLPVVDRSLI